MEQVNNMGFIFRYFKWFGYGFIKTDSGETIFFHASDFIDEEEKIIEGSRVLFKRKKYIKDGKRVVKAVNVELY